MVNNSKSYLYIFYLHVLIPTNHALKIADPENLNVGVKVNDVVNSFSLYVLGGSVTLILAYLLLADLSPRATKLNVVFDPALTSRKFRVSSSKIINPFLIELHQLERKITMRE